MKKQLGQYYTTYIHKILNNIILPNDISVIIEPFAGKGNIVEFIGSKYQWETYDIDVKYKGVIHRNTLLDPPDYHNKYVITNPPYLSKNHSSDKTLFEKYNVDDLYKIFMYQLIENPPTGGIVILPLNFLSSYRKTDTELRTKFINTFNIDVLNVWENDMFKDTSCIIFMMQFSYPKTHNNYKCTFLPMKRVMEGTFTQENYMSVGGEINYLINNSFKNNDLQITRKKNNFKLNIYVHCIDTGKMEGRIKYIYNDKDISYSSRCETNLYSNKEIKNQKELVEILNQKLNYYRFKTNSMFLSSFYNIKEYPRKRMSFSMACKFARYVILLNHS